MEHFTKLQTQLPASPVAYEVLTIDGSVQVPTPANVARCTFAIIKFQTGPARYRDDGTDPTAAIGTPVFNLDEKQFSVASMRKLRFIRSGVTNMSAYIHYYA